LILGSSFGSELEPDVNGADKEIELDPGASDIVLFFDAASKSSAPIEFRYRLADFDSNWTITRDRIAHYRHLPAGQYRFEVQAHNSGQAWRTVTAELPVVQHHFFYQTWLFYWLLFFGLAGLAIELLRQRDQLLKGQMAMVMEERKRIASDCHDTLMVGFAAISWQLEATAKLLLGSDDRSLRAAQACELARKMVAHCQAETRQIIWDLRDSSEITNILSNALSRTLTENFVREDIDLVFEVEGAEIPIAPAAVHHVVCIGQEAVTNAIRHSNATRIEVRVLYETDSLNLTIRDNGHGFHLPDNKALSGHFGILVMQERSRKIGGSFQINTSPGSGTQIVLEVDFGSLSSQLDLQEHVVSWIGL
jgi:signal transduction histidine kinase